MAHGLRTQSVAIMYLSMNFRVRFDHGIVANMLSEEAERNCSHIATA
ncbi:hypothetical protein Mchl_3850 [Methylorubrum extorquens CM4]|uniref:Uncharacterized protein n=1 Tax=Methylorubrum extorquens (strain CM4 / NCIMB 13688) TaxID=440085 RepID=B7KXR0_METC4|nr:hypothetical protein Mchl_3850 [Methylorubrum extorquens CM4]